MPTYDYRCEACGHEFEEFQSITAKPLKKCPTCGKQKLKRLIGIGAGIIFKGSGFYETDYRSDSYKQAAKAEKESTSGSSGDKAEKKADSPAGASTSSSDAAKPATPAPAAAAPAKAAGTASGSRKSATGKADKK